MELKRTAETYSIIPLQIAVGVFQTLIGAMLLVAPHQFTNPTYAVLQPNLGLWGIAFFTVGSLLLITATVGLPGLLDVAVHIVAGAMFLALAYSIALVRGWPGTINFGSLGLAIAAAPLLAATSRRSSMQERDLLVVAVGPGALATGTMFLLAPGQFTAPLYDTIRSFLPAVGVSFLMGGLALAAITLRPSAPRIVVLAAHLVAAATFIGYFSVSSLPTRAWIGIVYYGGFGIAIASLPWWRARLANLNRASLRVRLALMLCLVAVAPLLFTTSYVLDQQEEATVQVAQADQTRLAVAVAQDVADYVGLHRALVTGLAAVPGLLDEPSEAQHTALKAFLSAYPAVYILATTDPAGYQIARSDDLPLVRASGVPLLELIKQTGRTELVAQASPATHLPILAIGSPVAGPDGQPRGFVLIGIELSRVTEVLARGASRGGTGAYLVDNRGHVIAHPDSTLVASFADLSGQPPVAAMLASQQGAGALRYGPAPSERLAGYAQVADLDWGVVVERPVAEVLAGTRAQRDITFLVLIASALLAAGLGLAMANNLVRPLSRLVTAVGEIASGDRRVALPEPRVSELQLLSKAIGEMDDRLAVTEAERLRLLEQLQAQNKELRVSNEALIQATKEAEAALKARDEFLSVAAHELKTPVTGLLGFAQTLLRQMAKSREVDPERLRHSLQVIDRQAQKTSRLVAQLLDISRFDRGQLRLECEQTDLVRIVGEVVEAAQTTTTKHTISVEAPTPVECFVDAARIEQVIAHLIDNAIRFSPHGGAIEVSVAQPDNRVEFSVRDHGIGIPAEHRSQLFDRFNQAHSAEYRSGLGLGLYISSQIVSLHGGEMEVDTPQGGGTRFTVVLPKRGA